MPDTITKVYVVCAQCYGKLFANDIQGLRHNGDCNRPVEIVGLSEVETHRYYSGRAAVDKMCYHLELTQWFNDTFPSIQVPAPGDGDDIVPY